MIRRFLCAIGVHGPRRVGHMVTYCRWCGKDTFNAYMAT